MLGFAIVHNVINVINSLIFFIGCFALDGPQPKIYFSIFGFIIMLLMKTSLCHYCIENWKFGMTFATECRDAVRRVLLHERQPKDFSYLSAKNSRQTLHGECGDWWEVLLPFLVSNWVWTMHVKYRNGKLKQNENQPHFSFRSFINCEYFDCIYHLYFEVKFINIFVHLSLLIKMDRVGNSQAHYGSRARSEQYSYLFCELSGSIFLFHIKNKKFLVLFHEKN